MTDVLEMVQRNGETRRPRKRDFTLTVVTDEVSPKLLRKEHYINRLTDRELFTPLSSSSSGSDIISIIILVDSKDRLEGGPDLSSVGKSVLRRERSTVSRLTNIFPFCVRRSLTKPPFVLVLSRLF